MTSKNEISIQNKSESLSDFLDVTIIPTGLNQIKAKKPYRLCSPAARYAVINSAGLHAAAAISTYGCTTIAAY
jgi:hypothetical protein